MDDGIQLIVEDQHVEHGSIPVVEGALPGIQNWASNGVLVGNGTLQEYWRHGMHSFDVFPDDVAD